MIHLTLPDFALMCRRSWCAVTALLVGSLPAFGDRVSFDRQVRPILAENCFQCHGPDEGSREADLRLDQATEATVDVISPGDSEESLMMQRIVDGEMPPPESNRSLTTEQIATLKQWVDEGAQFEKHWAFQSPGRTVVPDSSTASDETPSSPVDRFVLRRLEQAGLQAAPEADRSTLIRRVTFDVTGLPPTVDEIESFVADQSPNAYEKLVDRLLARPEFGERLASGWLDLARYSDTFGYQVDRDRFVWPWRDWVIDSLNADMPYDQFITWQIAGDLLPHATRQQILATTFNRLHPQKVEGGSVPEEFRIEYVSDRTQTFATALMGLTFECCRCHDHKFDPISQREYFQLSAFFDNIAESGLYSFFTNSVPTPTLTLPTAQQQLALDDAKLLVADRQAELDRLLAEKAQSRIGGADLTSIADDEVAFAEPIKSMEFDDEPGGNNRRVEGVDGSAARLSGDDPIKTDVGNFKRWQPFSVSLWIKTPDRKDRAVVLHRSRAWTDAGSRGYQLLIEEGHLTWSLVHFLPGNAIQIRAAAPLPIDRWTHVVVSSDGSSRAAGLSIHVDGDQIPTSVVRDSLTKQITGGGGDTITIGERFRDRGFTDGCVDRLRVFDCQLTELEIERLASQDETIAWLRQPATWSDAKRQIVMRHLLQRSDAEVIAARAALVEAKSKQCRVEDDLTEIMVMREEPSQRATYLLVRGAYDHPDARVLPDTPGALPSFPAGEPNNRLGLARWLCDPEHPLTSRVAANRLWQHCFGFGLVRTPEDFGTQGSRPTHPQLLDWLATELVRRDWDLKSLLRTILLSDTYRRSNIHADPRLDEVDPENQWLARFPATRLSAEMLRDHALAAAGQLDRTVGGPPVKPYDLESSFKPAKRDSGSGLYRRSLYTYWKRTAPAPAMMTFDASKRDVCRVSREMTQSPLQAFVLLNGPQFVEASRILAERMMSRHGARSDEASDAIDGAFHVLTSRRATTEEQRVLNALYRDQHEHFRANPTQAVAYLDVGDAPPPPAVDRSSLAALTMVVNTIMNHHESVTKR